MSWNLTTTTGPPVSPARIMESAVVQTIDKHDTDDILSAILPEDILDDIPSGFNPVGHIGSLPALKSPGCSRPDVQHCV